jgi:hypothetical protein
MDDDPKQKGKGRSAEASQDPPYLMSRLECLETTYRTYKTWVRNLPENALLMEPSKPPYPKQNKTESTTTTLSLYWIRQESISIAAARRQMALAFA